MLYRHYLTPLLLPLIVLACGPTVGGQQGPISDGQGYGPGQQPYANPNGTYPPLTPASSHCDVLTPTLQKHKMHCLEIPAYLAIGVYGAKSYPNESTFEMGFNGQIPAGLVGAPRDAGTVSRSFSTTKSAKASLGLTLSQFYSWLPDVTISGDADDEFTVEVTLTELTLTPVQNLPETIRPIVISPANDARTQAVRGMLAKLCRADTVVTTFALSAKPLIKITNKSHSSLKADIGWEKIAGFDADATNKAGGSVGLTGAKPIVLAVELRDSEPWVRDLCQLKPPPPPAAPTLSLARVTWTTIGDDKDFDTQPTVEVYDRSGRKIADISCCSADRNIDKWEGGRKEGRNLVIKNAASKSDLAQGRFSAFRTPVGNDNWDYTAAVELTFSDGSQLVKSCSGRNSCGQSW